MTATLTEQIKILVELQKIDLEIFRLKKELSSHPELQKKLDADFEKKKVHAKTAEDESKAFALKQKQQEGELAVREEKILKLQGQLYQLKSNKEYSAMELEIKGLKADKSVLEEEILKMLDGGEAVKSRLAKEKEQLGVEEKRYKADTEELAKRSKELQDAIAALDEKRQAFLGNVEKRYLSQYERILKGRDGLAIVPVLNGACGGCHLELPPQTIHETRLHEKWIACESCARILYWPEGL